MAIQISGTTVIDNSRNITNMESIGGNGVATQAEAEAGTLNDQFMTPLRVSQAISALSTGSGVDGDIDWSTCNVGCAVRGGGNVIYKSSGVIWIVAPSTTEERASWPMGYCNGSLGNSVNAARSLTGRSGWFIPDREMLQTAYSCRSYWDTYVSTHCYWSSNENSACAKTVVNFRCALNTCRTHYVAVNCYKYYVRPMRVVCY